MKIRVFLLLMLSAYHTNGQLANKYKICTKPGYYNDCQQLDRSNEIECEENFSSLDCLINVNSGRTSFGSVTPEEALIAARFLDNIVVLGEFRANDYIFEDSLYQTVVVVNSSFTGDLSSLRGARYCHPGFKYDVEVTELLLKEFEVELFNRTGLDICSVDVQNSTLVEKHIKTLADFFGPSCRPGPETENAELNQLLKERYPSLCELCPDNCTPFTSQVFISSLVCLTERNADVAVTSLHSVQRFFNSSENQQRIWDYRFLCRNGSVNTLDNPCIWSKQPWNLIIANRDIAGNLSPLLKEWLAKYSTLPEATPMNSPLSQVSEESLVAILMPEDLRYHKINFLDNPVNLTGYLNNFRNIVVSENVTQCGTTMNWCTTSLSEHEKCQWLSQAGANRGVQPVVNCIPATSKISCIEAIQSGTADVVDINTRFGYIARRRGLEALAYGETVTRNLTMVLIVVKNSSDLTSLETLRGKGACIAEYATLEWLAFANRLAQGSNACDLDQTVRDFVGRSCMPGAHDSGHGVITDTYDEQLCGICQPSSVIAKTATTCDADSTNLYYGREGALRCLQEVGDFAVITKGDYNVNPEEFRVICSNGSLASYPGFQVDQACALAVVINNEVVARSNNSKNFDISVALFEFERWFGQDRRKPFELFNTFNGTTDLLFKESTPGLDGPSSSNVYIQNYKSQLQPTCRSSASGLRTTSFLLSAILLFFTWRLIL